MKKKVKHELYCSCQSCKPGSRSLVILKPEELPLLEAGGERQRPTEGPSKPPYAEGGS